MHTEMLVFNQAKTSEGAEITRNSFYKNYSFFGISTF